MSKEHVPGTCQASAGSPEEDGGARTKRCDKKSVPHVECQECQESDDDECSWHKEQDLAIIHVIHKNPRFDGIDSICMIGHVIDCPKN